MNALCMLSVAACVVLAGPGESSGAQQSITPDQRLQTAIDRAVEPTQSRAEMYAQLEELKRLAAKSPEHFLEQLLYYYSNQQNDRQRRFRAFLLVGHLRLPKTVIAEVASRYAYAEDEDLSAEARRLLHIAEEGWRGEPGRYYEPVIRARKDDSALGLIRFMFETSPERAIRVMLRVEEDDRTDLRSVRWGEHVVSDYLWKRRHRFDQAADETLASAVKELDAMSRHGTWWVRLYVAQILRQYAQLRTPELIERLKADEHELVRRAILEIDKRKSRK
jgi:hypothetical protein